MENQIAVPPQFNVGAPEGNNLCTDIAQIIRGNYISVDVTNGGVDTQITVAGPAETNYDLVYYEWYWAGSGVGMDHVIVGISQDAGGNGDPYYEVFNWGDGNPDTNSSLDTSQPLPNSGVVLNPAE